MKCKLIKSFWGLIMKRRLLIFVLLILIASPFNFANALDRYGDEGDALSFHVNYVYRSEGKGELKPINNGDVLKSGDHFKIIFTPDKDCYVYIFQVDSSGQIFKLFPMKSFMGVQVNNFNPVTKGTTYTLPSSEKAFMLDDQVGTERIYFIVSKERNKEIERLDIERKEPIDRQKPNLDKNTQDKKIENAEDKLNKYFKRRGITVVPSGQPVRVQWQEGGDVFSVIGQKLENLCEDCVHILEFIHKDGRSN
ncbi:unnamed protein product [marine sediment metagenome]|uniref:DUF4384 domain-containing protein n=1 Tax=marine sediment metagenome TaxID=412755 RepID=X1A063_9ZZZZ